MLTFSRYKFMRKYTIDVFNIMKRKKTSKIRVFFLQVYKERLKRRFINKSLLKKRKYYRYFKNLKRTLRLNKRYGFFEHGAAPRTLDKENKPLSFHGYWLTQYKLFTNFYNNLKMSVLKRLWLKASTGRVVIFNYFLTLLESRIDSMLIRLNWVPSKHMIRSALRRKWFLVNQHPVIFTNFLLTNFECLTVVNSKKFEIFKDLQKRVQQKFFFYKPPFYLEVNHKTLSCLIIQKFVKRGFVKYPFKFKSEALVYISYAKR